ncbi:MAG: D-alanyl-D-alanine carboxypeptidase [Burkholderiaceae bacterium]|nr:MAG: D-alanyl-D-alanine carboxypeptidase [Burkholderiaceae bacterium]
MNRFTSALRALVSASLLAPLALLAAAPKEAPKTAAAPVAAVVTTTPSWLPQPPEVAARTYLVMDMTSKQILAQKDIDAPVEQASLTKLMTAYLVFDALRSKKITLTQTFPVSVRAWKMPGSRMFIDPKMQVPVDDLIKGMIVQSGNDAAMALAEGVGGTEEHFVQMMNDEAKALGMTGTSYKNPDGLTEPGHITTARDLATLAMRLRSDFPEYAYYDAIKKYHYPGTPPSNDTNRNGLLFRDPTVDGLKTGHTEAAGYCLIATAKRDFPNIGSRRVMTVVLGTATEAARLNESQKLLNWGYTAYEDIKLFGANQPAVTPSVWKGKENVLKLGRPEGIVVSVPAGSAGKIKTQVVRPDPLVAPFVKGQQVGTLKVSLGDQPLTDVPLVVLEPVEQAGVLGRAWDALRLWIK